MTELDIENIKMLLRVNNPLKIARLYGVDLIVIMAIRDSMEPNNDDD